MRTNGSSGISLTLRGSSKVYWTEHQRRIRSGDGDETETMPCDSVPFTSSECYLNTTYLAPTLAFGAGPLQVPFDLTLPDPLPASFEGEFGRVRYKIIVRVKRLNRSSDFKCERPFVVRGVKDLNDWPFASVRVPFTAVPSVATKKCLICWSIAVAILVINFTSGGSIRTVIFLLSIVQY